MKKKVIKEKVEKGKKIFSFIIRILISIVLGFLPSFIFIALFIQYGSPFLNYTKFLLNLNSSLGAWASAIVIGFFAYFIIWIIKTRKNFKKIIKNKIFLVVILLCFFVALFLIFMQLYLYINFVLGNDVLVRLSADKDNLFFVNNLDEEVTFKTSVIMNPFCSAQCEYEFFDISNGKEIEKGQFNILSIFSKSKSYTFDKNKLIRGQILNQFEVSCKSKKTTLCYTREKESKRSVLITLNYELNEEEDIFKNKSREKLISFRKKLLTIEDLLNKSQTNINSINYSFVENFSQQLEDLSKNFVELNKSFENLKKLWETQNFIYLEKELNNSYGNKLEEVYIDSKQLSSNIISNMSFYNNLIDNLINSKQILFEISQRGITDSLCGELNNLIVDFNEAVRQFKEQSELSEKLKIVENISFEVEEFHKKIQDIDYFETISVCYLSQNIFDEDLEKIEIVSIENTFPVISLKEPTSICCFFGQCEVCCDEKCSDENYPIIFLHGHSINKALPVDYSFDSFAEIKEQLVNEDYIDAGAMVISSTDERKGLWGKVNAPIMVTASYFFDAYKEDSGEVIVSSNADSIDTYAIRLRDIVELIKHRTNKGKVILVAQSGGGLVVRRYIQIFGAENVDKVILITVPNHGIDEKTKGYCVLLGPAVACNDMSEKSIFINKLNNALTEEVLTYNFIGIGCNMGSETGDGIIKNSSQYLDYATNYYIKGSCNELSFEFFHENIVYPSQYPEVYDILKQILKK